MLDNRETTGQVLELWPLQKQTWHLYVLFVFSSSTIVFENTVNGQEALLCPSSLQKEHLYVFFPCALDFGALDFGALDFVALDFGALDFGAILADYPLYLKCLC